MFQRLLVSIQMHEGGLTSSQYVTNTIRLDYNTDNKGLQKHMVKINCLWGPVGLVVEACAPYVEVFVQLLWL